MKKQGITKKKICQGNNLLVDAKISATNQKPFFTRKKWLKTETMSNFQHNLSLREYELCSNIYIFVNPEHDHCRFHIGSLFTQHYSIKPVKDAYLHRFTT